MRKTFLYPVLNMLKQRNLKWVLSQISKYVKIKTGKLAGPIMGIIVPTYRCNSNCCMCSLTSFIEKEQKELDTYSFRNIIDGFCELNVSGISFTGGEPLLRTDIFELLEYSKAKGVATTLNTNGILLDEERIKKLLQIEPDNVNISIDSASAENFSKIRGVTPKIFNSIIDSIRNLSNLKKLKNKRTTVTIVCVILKDNIKDIGNIIELSSRLKADKIGFMPLHNITANSVSCKNDISLNINELISQARKNSLTIDNTKKYLDMFKIAFSGGTFPIKCYAGLTSVIVDCYKNIYACWPFLELKEKIKLTEMKSLKEIWYSEEYNKTREKTAKCRMCFWNCHAEMSIFFN